MAGVRDGKINVGGRIVPKCVRLLSNARPAARADSVQSSRREARPRAAARWCKTVRPVVLSTGLVSGIVLALCWVVRLNISPSVPPGLYRIVDQPVRVVSGHGRPSRGRFWHARLLSTRVAAIGTLEICRTIFAAPSIRAAYHLVSEELSHLERDSRFSRTLSSRAGDSV